MLRADKLRCTDFASLYYLGCIFKDHLEKPDKAINYFIRSIEKNSGYDEPYNKLGEIYMIKYEMNKAEYYLALGYEWYQKRPELLNNYGLVLLNLNKLELAEKVLSQWINIDPSHFKAYNNLGNVMRNLDRLSDAIHCYK